VEEVVIVSTARTPFGKLGGAISTVPAVSLGACVIRTALERGSVPFEAVDQVIMGTVITAGQGRFQRDRPLSKQDCPRKYRR
jgi:acetyl-CoA C-acetyltransferase